MAQVIWRTGRVLIIVIILLALTFVATVSMFSNAQSGEAAELVVDSDVPEDVLEPGVISKNKYEISDRRNTNQRVWEVVREIETIDPATGEIVIEEQINTIVGVGNGICYTDPNGQWQVSEAVWRATDHGFVMDRAGYKLDVGSTADSWLRYEYEGSNLLLTPSEILAFDGTNIESIATIQENVFGVIDPNDPSRLVFADAFGPGIDLELQTSPGGYHQNIIFHEEPVLPRAFDPESTEIMVYTEMNMDMYSESGTLEARTQGSDRFHVADFGSLQREDISSRELLADLNTMEPTKDDITLAINETIDGRETTYPLHRFTDSEVFDSAPARQQKELARKQLFHDDQGRTFLVERLDHSFFQEASYPVVWDYSTVAGTLTSDTVWYARNTYFVYYDLTVDTNSLRIEPGTIVKFDGSIKITTSGTGRVIAKGKPYLPIVFTSIHDDVNGEQITYPPATSSGNPSRGDYYGVKVGDGSQIEHCSFFYASKALDIQGELDLPIQHNYFSLNEQSIYMGTDILEAGESLVIFNNLIVSNDPCEAAIGINGPTGTTGNVYIYNNTIHLSYEAILLSSTCEHNVNMQNNIFSTCSYAIRAEAGHDGSFATSTTDGFYNNTNDHDMPVGWSPTNSRIAGANPFYSDSGYHEYLLNDSDPGGSYFTDAGTGTAASYYNDVYAWAIHNLKEVASSRSFTSTQTISTDTTWDMQTTTCDTGTVDLGYHAPRVDYLINSVDITVNGTTSSATLTIDPGTVIVQQVNSSTGAGKLTIDGDDQAADSLICVGDPFGDGYITWVDLGRVHRYNQSGVVPLSNRKNNIEFESGSDYDIRFTKFLGLGRTVVPSEESGTIRDCVFMLNTRGVDYQSCSGFEIYNCLFVANNMGVRDYLGTGGLVSNCTFDTNRYGVVVESNGAVDVVSCLLVGNVKDGSVGHGISYRSASANLSESYNAFYGNDYDYYDTTGTPGAVELDSTDWTDDTGATYASEINGNPLDSSWIDFADRFHIDSDSYVIDNGYDPSSEGMVGYTTSLDETVDSPNIDIGYHYPRSSDTDGDGLYDFEEYWLGTDHTDVDSDDDGLTDGSECVNVGLYPGGIDADGDGYVDGEMDYGTDPMDATTDADSLPDGWEVLYGLEPLDATGNNGDGGDQDVDGMDNDDEYSNGSDPTTNNSGDSWTEYEYDDAGNVTATLQYEFGNSTPLSEAHSQYDDLGRRYMHRALATSGGAESNSNDNISIVLYNSHNEVTRAIQKGVGSSSLTSFDVPADIITEYSYNNLGRRTQMVFDPYISGQSTLQLTTSYLYDQGGRVTKVTAPDNTTTDTEYDAVGRTVKVTNALGNYTEADYDSRGRAIKTILYNSADTAMSQHRSYYDSVGQVSRQVVMATPSSASAPSTSTDRVTDYVYTYDSAKTRYVITYNGANAITAKTITSSNDSSGRGMPTEITKGLATDEPKAIETRFMDKAGRVTKKIVDNYDESDSVGLSVTTRMEYEGHGRLQYLIASGVSELTTTYAYDGPGRRVKVINPEGNETTYAYDSFGKMTQKIEDAAGGGLQRTTTYQYDRLGRLVTLIADNGANDQTTIYDYDEKGNVTDITYPDSGSIAYLYNETGRVTRRTDQESRVTDYQYDSTGRLVTKSTDSVKEVYDYDARGLMVLAQKGDNGTDYDDVSYSDFAYDGLGALTLHRQEILDSTVTKSINYTRNQRGKATNITYPDSTQITYSYTSMDQINLVSKSATELVDYNYNGAMVKNRTYDLTSDVTFTPMYDSFGRVTRHKTLNSEVTPAGVNFAYTYDQNSNIISKVFDHRSGVNNVYSYDDLDRVTGVTYHDSDTEAFNMDILGNRDGDQTLRDEGTVNYIVDPLTNQYDSVAPMIGWWKLDEASGSSAADATGNGHAGTLNNFSGTYWVTGQYDNALDFDGTDDRVVVSDDAAFDTGSQVTVSHWFKTGTAQDGKAMVIHDNSSYKYMTYLTTDSKYITFYIRQSSGVKAVAAYDASGWNDDQWHHVVGIFDRNPSSGTRLKLYVDGTLHTPGTDALDEDIVTGDEGIEFGRWTSAYFDGMIDNVQIFDGALTALQVSALYGSQTGKIIDYDDCGNLVRDKGGYKYSYDYDNRITKIEKPDGAGDWDDVVDYTYDALGRRIEKDDGTTAIRYYYDGQRVLLETDDANDDQRSYVFGNYIDEVLVMTDHTAQNDPDYFYGHDHLYSSVVLFDSAGDVQERYEYNAYGEVQVMDDSYNNRTSSLYLNPYLFTGRRLDTLDSNNFKIYYYRARYYDADIGRMLQHDPLGTDPVGGRQNPFRPLKQYKDGMSLYEYVQSSPVIKGDPSGQKTEIAGLTSCNPDTGEVEIQILDNPHTRCWGDVVKEHEDVHKEQLSSCCERYAKCKMWFSETTCSLHWSVWSEANLNRFECEAHTKSAQIYHKYWLYFIKNLAMPCPRRSGCLGELVNGKAWADVMKEEHCNDQGPEVPCPFSEDGYIN